MLFYDIYFLITKDQDENFGIIELQINNIPNIRMETFKRKDRDYRDKVESQIKNNARD